MNNKSEIGSSVAKRSKTQIRIGALLSYILIILQVLASLFFTPWLSRYLGISQYGVYTLAISLTTFFVSDYGLSAAAGTFLSEYEANNEVEKEEDFLGVLEKIYAILDLVVAVIALTCFFFIGSIFSGLSAQEQTIFKPLYFVVIVYCLYALPIVPVNGIFTAKEDFIALKVFSFLTKIGQIGAMALFVVFNANLITIVCANVISTALVDLAKLLYLRFKHKLKIKWFYFDWGIFKAILSLSLWLALSVICQQITISLFPTILAKVSNSTEISVFGYSRTIMQYVEMIGNVVGGMFLPTIARYCSSNKYNPDLFPLFVKVGKYQLSIFGLIFIGFVCLGSFFVDHLMGGQFSDSYLCSILLFIPYFFVLPKTTLESYSYILNNVKYSGLIRLFFSILICGFSFLLGSRFGAVGVCSCYGVGMSLSQFVVDIWVYGVKGRTSIWAFFKKCYLPFAPSFLLALPISYLVCFYWKASNWFIFIAQACIIIVIYVVLVFFFSLTKEEKNYIFSLFKRKKVD